MSLPTIKKAFRMLTLFFLGWFALHQTFIITDGLRNDTGKADVAVILGNTVHPDGSLSARLQARLDKGLEWYQNGVVKRLMVSGGLGKEGHYEGSKMAVYLQTNGVPQTDIIVDNKGNNTKATALNFVQQFPTMDTVVVVSQFYHVPRTKLAFHQAGVEVVYGVKCDYYEARDVYSLVREFPAYYKYWLF